MSTITYIFTINHVAKKFGEYPELRRLSYGSIISVYDGNDEQSPL